MDLLLKRLTFLLPPTPNRWYNAVYFQEAREAYNLLRIPVLNTPVTKDPEHFAFHHSRMQSTISS